MEQKRFIIVNKILGELVYDLPMSLKYCPICEKEPQTNIDADVRVRKRDEIDNDYIVEIDVSVTEGIINRWIKKQANFRMRLGFLVIVKVAGEETDEKEIVEMLETEVPKSVVPDIQSLITSISDYSGLPQIWVNEHIFDAKKSLANESAALKIGYEWLINDINSSKEGTGFLRALIEAFGGSALEYKESPLYKYYYRFLNPIKYSHPHFDECNDEYWDFLFQLIFAECDSIEIEETQEGIPEIIFSYEEHQKMSTSNLTLEQVKEITSDLGATALTTTMVAMFGTDINRDYGDTLPDDTQLLEWEMKELYNYKPNDTEVERVELFKRICSRLKRYSELTFRYHLTNE